MIYDYLSNVIICNYVSSVYLSFITCKLWINLRMNNFIILTIIKWTLYNYLKKKTCSRKYHFFKNNFAHFLMKNAFYFIFITSKYLTREARTDVWKSRINSTAKHKLFYLGTKGKTSLYSPLFTHKVYIHSNKKSWTREKRKVS